MNTLNTNIKNTQDPSKRGIHPNDCQHHRLHHPYDHNRIDSGVVLVVGGVVGVVLGGGVMYHYWNLLLRHHFRPRVPW